MEHNQKLEKKSSLALPSFHVLVCYGQRLIHLSDEGEIQEYHLSSKPKKITSTPPLVCHAPSFFARTKEHSYPVYDILELFAFIHPAKFCIPNAAGLCNTLGLPAPHESDDHPYCLLKSVEALLKDLQDEIAISSVPLDVLQAMPQWIWRPVIEQALKLDKATLSKTKSIASTIQKLPEWSEHAPPQPSGHLSVTIKEATEQLEKSLAIHQLSPRHAQKTYIQTAIHAFSPMISPEKPNLALLQAGTGTGKTLAYLAPSVSWAQKNEGPVWISTYTKNLQRQLSQELSNLYPDPIERQQKTVIRKGRENYICLLNFEDALRRSSFSGNSGHQLFTGLITRWLLTTKNGDIKGGDLPGWLASLFGMGHINSLSDRRGECIHAACPHYHRCFIEKSIRQSKRAEIVVANHALVMINNALKGDLQEENYSLPTRYVFDEGHHLFDAADNAFSSYLSGQETLELRRWLMGNEQAKGFRSGRSRGLRARAEEMMGADEKTFNIIQKMLFSARELASQGWLDRLKNNNPLGPIERFLGEVYSFILSRSSTPDSFYDLEAEKSELPPALIFTAGRVIETLALLLQHTKELLSHLEDRLKTEQESLEKSQKQKIEGLIKSLERRIINSLESWINMLDYLNKKTPVEFYDWFSLQRIEGRDFDLGFARHWVDPMQPFVKTLEPHSHGLIITSATLTEGSAQESTLQNAENRLGVSHFKHDVKPYWEDIASPFDFKHQAKVIIINDLDTTKISHVANAYRSLFSVSKGGGLGLFTSIQRLKSVHNQLIKQWPYENGALYSQHIDGIDIATLIDIFKEEENSCLLGTDAIRDGVDIPGQSLRLMVYDKVPWPRPSLLHKMRRQNFGKRQYDEMLTRLKLKQAFGRLIRSKKDKGVFVMLESRLPTRLCDAFPIDCSVERMSLKESIQSIQSFFK